MLRCLLAFITALVTLNDLRNGQCAQTENPISLKCADENVESSQKFYDVITLEFWRSLLDGVFCRFLFFDRSTCDENDAFDEGVIEGRYFDVALELIFGEKPSVGKICGITESVIDETSDSIPGTCCLDSPAQSDNEDMGSVWGQPVRTLTHQFQPRLSPSTCAQPKSCL